MITPEKNPLSELPCVIARALPLEARSGISLAKRRLFRAKACSYYDALMENQNLPTTQLEQLNWEKRKRLLTYAFNNVPIYRRKYSEAGLHPSDVNSPDDFEKLPIICREDLQNHFREFLSKEARPDLLALATTGGSTGTLVKVMHDKRVPLDPLGWRTFSWWGLDLSVD
jgi:phenylacetate-CoA ligase